MEKERVRRNGLQTLRPFLNDSSRYPSEIDKGTNGSLRKRS
jgi:hypothetical protein